MSNNRLQMQHLSGMSPFNDTDFARACEWAAKACREASREVREAKEPISLKFPGPGLSAYFKEVHLGHVSQRMFGALWPDLAQDLIHLWRESIAPPDAPPEQTPVGGKPKYSANNTQEHAQFMESAKQVQAFREQFTDASLRGMSDDELDGLAQQIGNQIATARQNERALAKLSFEELSDLLGKMRAEIARRKKPIDTSPQESRAPGKLPDGLDLTGAGDFTARLKEATKRGAK